MAHLVLLGDSIFDNAVYVPNHPDVITQLRGKLPEGWQATLCAVDGDCINDVHAQLDRIPEHATHLFISVGGNDALRHTDILDQRVNSAVEVFLTLAHLSERFSKHYHQLLSKVLPLQLPTTLCTIYYPRFPDSLYNRLAIAALSIFNDVIIRAAFRAGIPLIDLRLTCNQASDYANPIEPSAAGGEKITHTILKVALEHNFHQPRTQVFY